MQKTAFDLKVEAHLLIYDLQSYGWSKKKIYRKLASKLGVPERYAHFHNMIFIDRIERSIELLIHLSDKRN